MFRRGSYAQVASGSTGTTQPNSIPSQSGQFVRLSNSGSIMLGTGILGQSHHARSIDADGYHASMSNSLGRSGPAPSYTSQMSHMGGYGALQDGGAPTFFVPSYLQGSRYAEKLEEEHKARIAAYREQRSSNSSNAASLSTSSSSVNLHKPGHSYRGLAHEIIERAPSFVDEPIVSWPTRWDERDKYPQMEVEEDGRLAKFAGAGKSAHDEAAAIRADHPMPRQCGIYYYEVTVVSKGRDGIIGVGFSGSKVPLNRIPGWEPDSFAYHGDDGLCFTSTTSGKPYGEKFGTLDVIGCGINFHTNTAFFTKNGRYLGTAFKDLKPNMQYYPSIGMKKNNEALRANFGQEPFAFDIDTMIQHEKAKIQQEIVTLRAQSKEHGSTDETQFIQGLIGQYLAHDGYVETARKFAQEVRQEAKALSPDGSADVSHLQTEEDIDAVNRQRIRAAILDGDIDKALKHTNAYYPSVLRDNENIYFKLRCRKFIEMIRSCAELNAQLQPTIPTPSSKRSTASTLNKRNSTATDEYDFEMELDEQLGVHNGAPWENEDDEDDDLEAKQKKLGDLTQAMIEYGMELKQEFANDPRREVKRALEDTFALIAYENVRESSLAPLLETKGRVPVAEELNSAILVSLGKSSSAALERLVQQTEALVSELADDGGPGAFINVRKDFLQ
ncbi:Ran-binding protein-like protein [Bimuria novae-zelandiae CBS 107.79]|uniref:Ran-binding protein-like protein n=1 Tax=Bimuria novae-zelandiae CBS 107.79 TaxID=1447943 RepID=A0A6A5V9I3_9PLEO|nr:Ran-binding protein-like protein [Bimuria novae-zelandiae CBS 107.79]